MKSSGEILKSRRLQLGFTLDNLSTKLKIQEKYLKALEEGENELFDSKVIARGFLIKYCRVLGLNEEKIEAFWRRDFNLSADSKPVSKSFIEKIYITPRVLVVGIFIIFVLVILGVSLFEYYTLKIPPVLVIYEPKDGVSINDDSVVVKGKTEKSTEVYLNNKKLNLSDNGDFSEKIYLINGFNKLSFKSLSPFGVETSKIVNVYASYQKVSQDGKNSNNILNVKSRGGAPVFIEVKNNDKQIFSGFLMPDVTKEFRGDSLYIYTDSVESVEIVYNGKTVEVKEAGIYTKNFNLTPTPTNTLLVK